MPRTRIRLTVLAALMAGACTTVQGVAPPATPAPEDAPPVTTAPRPEEAPPGARIPVADEVRGVWVVRTTLTTPEGVREMVRRTHEAGFNTLLVQVRGRGDAFYTSTLEPRAEALAHADPGFDPLALTIREAHARGMKVHAWVVAQLVWGLGDLPRDPDHLLNRHPDWLSVPRPLAEELWSMDPRDPRYSRRIQAWAVENRERVEGVFADPGHPGVRERLAGVVGDLLERYPLDGIHLDYLRYSSPDFDYSRGSLERFREWAGNRLPPGISASLDARVAAGDVTAWTRENPALWDTFRTSRVTGLLREVRRAVDAHGEGALLTAAVFADPVDAERARFQEWRRWLTAGTLDAVAPMAYTPDDLRFADLIRAALEADGSGAGRRIWAGIGVYQTTLDGAIRKMALARDAGAGGVVLFSYDWAHAQAHTAGGEPYLDALVRGTWGSLEGPDGRSPNPVNRRR